MKVSPNKLFKNIIAQNTAGKDALIHRFIDESALTDYASGNIIFTANEQAISKLTLPLNLLHQRCFFS